MELWSRKQGLGTTLMVAGMFIKYFLSCYVSRKFVIVTLLLHPKNINGWLSRGCPVMEGDRIASLRVILYSLEVFAKETIQTPKREGCNFWIETLKYFEKSDKNGSLQPKFLYHILVGVSEVDRNDDGLPKTNQSCHICSIRLKGLLAEYENI